MSGDQCLSTEHCAVSCGVVVVVVVVLCVVCSGGVVVVLCGVGVVSCCDVSSTVKMLLVDCALAA